MKKLTILILSAIFGIVTYTHALSIVDNRNSVWYDVQSKANGDRPAPLVGDVIFPIASIFNTVDKNIRYEIEFIVNGKKIDTKTIEISGLRKGTVKTSWKIDENNPTLSANIISAIDLSNNTQRDDLKVNLGNTKIETTSVTTPAHPKKSFFLKIKTFFRNIF